MSKTWTWHVETDSGTGEITLAHKSSDMPALEPATEFGTSWRLEDPATTFSDVEPYLRAPKAAVARRGPTQTEQPWFRERYHEGYPVESLLIGVEPDTDVFLNDGWWGLLVDASVESGNVGEDMSAIVIDTTWFVLAPFDDYATHDDVRDAYGDDI